MCARENGARMPSEARTEDQPLPSLSLHTLRGPQAAQGKAGRKKTRNQAAVLKRLWEKGLSGKTLLQEHTRLVDGLVRKAFSRIDARFSGDFAAIALGGYGRCELFPYSDVDLMLLHAPMDGKTMDEAAGAVFYPLWDTGLDLGHSVRTVGQCMEDAATDFFFQVALLDARRIDGSETLFDSLRKAFEENFVKGKRRDFTRLIMDHRAARIDKFGAHGHLLEPNLKEVRGGLRDIQSIRWTAKVLFGLEGFHDLMAAGLLTNEERTALDSFEDFLVRLRNRLHFASRRRNDRLYFEYQAEIARATGYRDTEGVLAVEHFMQDAYRTLDGVATAADLFFEHVEDVLDPDVNRSDDGPLEPGIEILSGRIHLTERLTRANALLVMKTFMHAASLGRTIHHRTRRAIRADLQAIAARLSGSRSAATIFIKLLESARDPRGLLDSMLSCGFLSAYIPELAHVLSLMQHDVYHVSTVDRHLIETVAALKNLKEEERSIYASLSRPGILFLAAILHDIGKGRAHGHAERGGEIAKVIGKRMGLVKKDLETLSFLIANHLFLMDTAQRRDLDDETFIIRCARHVGDKERLGMLYLLSIADARATGPNAWSGWKAALLQEFFLKLSHLLERSDFVDPDRVRAVAWMRSKVADRIGSGADRAIEAMPEDYLLAFSPDEISRHRDLAGRLASEPVVLVPEEGETDWSLLLVTRDRTGLLARLFGCLALHDLDVRSAALHTLGDGAVVDIVRCNSSIGTSFAEQDWDGLRRDLTLAVEDRLDIAGLLSEKTGSRDRYPCCTAADQETRVIVDNDVSDFHTLIEVHSGDRIGLLYEVTRTLASFGVGVFKAKLGTSADRVVDVFYVRSPDGEKLADPETIEKLRAAILCAAGRPRNGNPANQPGNNKKTHTGGSRRHDTQEGSSQDGAGKGRQDGGHPLS